MQRSRHDDAQSRSGPAVREPEGVVFVRAKCRRDWITGCGYMKAEGVNGTLVQGIEEGGGDEEVREVYARVE